MIKLELDWAANVKPDTGIVSEPDDDVIVVVEYDEGPSASGWPLVRAYATTEQEPFRATMALYAWLIDAYGVSDDEANELLSFVDDA